MKKIYAPWRESYIKNTVQKPNEKRKNIDCVFCHQLKKNDNEKFFILKRYEHSFVMMNLYPYNEGHLLVLPISHKKDLSSLTNGERHELIDSVNLGINAVQKVLKPHGFNVGINVRGIGKKDIARGDVIADAAQPPTIAEEFTAQIAIINHPTVVAKGYTPVFHVHTAQVPCQLMEILHKVDPTSGQPMEGAVDFLKNGDANY